MSKRQDPKEKPKEDKYALFMGYLYDAENENAYIQGTNQPIK